MQQTVGFRYEIVNDIYVYYVNAIDRNTVDAMYEAGTQQNHAAAATTGHLMRIWVIERPLFPTPYVRERLGDSVSNTPDNLYISSAIVLKEMAGVRAAFLFLYRMMTSRRRTEVEIFKTVDDALKWMEHRRTTIKSIAE